MRGISPAILVLALLSCSSPTEPQIPANAVPMAPLPIYATWWSEVMEDTDIHRDVSRVRWYLVETGPWESERYGGTTHGSWIPDGRIYLATGWEDWENLVKHEMLHELLQGDPNHTHPAFEQYPLTPLSNP